MTSLHAPDWRELLDGTLVRIGRTHATHEQFIEWAEPQGVRHNGIMHQETYINLYSEGTGFEFLETPDESRPHNPMRLRIGAPWCFV